MIVHISNIQEEFTTIPPTFFWNGKPYDGYDKFTELHEAHGWRNLTIPTFSPLTQKLSDTNELINNEVIRRVIDLSEEEINAKNKAYYDNWLKNKVTYLLIKAEGYAIGKEGDVDYIKTQIKLYETKYANATTLTPIAEIDADLALEGMRDFGVELEVFKQLIVYMFEPSQEAFALFVHYIEQCRSAILTLIASNEWDKVEQARVIVDSLASPTEAQTVKNLILNL